MPGLLDFANDPTMAMAMGLLSAGGPQSRPVSLGQAIGQGFQGMQEAKKAQLQDMLMKMQYMTAAQKYNYLNGDSSAQIDPNQMMSGSPSPQPQAMTQPGGLLGQPTASPQPVATSGQPGNSFGGKFGNLPDSVVRAEIALNDGKDIGKMIEARSKPDWQITNGYAINKNDPSFKGGFQPGINISTNGQASQTDIGPDGKPIITAPPGALDTYGAYKKADAGFQPPIKMKTPSGLEADVFPSEFPSIQRGLTPGRLAPTNVQQAARTDGTPIADVNMVGKGGAPSTTGRFDFSQLGISPSPEKQAELDAAKAAATTTATGAATAGQAYQTTLHDKVEQEYQLVNRNNTILPLLDRYKTGQMGGEERAHFGNSVANTSIPGVSTETMRKIGNAIAGGDAEAAKVLENQLASAGIMTMLQTLDKEGKPNRAIFETVKRAQEGLSSGNTTLKDVFAIQRQLYDTHFNEQQALTKAIKDGAYNPSTWIGDYSSIRNKSLDTPPSPLPSAENKFNELPPPNQYRGKLIKDTTTGKMLRSNGMKWMPEG